MVSACFLSRLGNLCPFQILLSLQTEEAQGPLKVVYWTGLEKWQWLSFFKAQEKKGIERSKGKNHSSAEMGGNLQDSLDSGEEAEY